MHPTASSIRLRRALSGDRADLEWTVQHLTPMLVAQARYRLRGRLQRECDPEDVVAHAWQVTLPRLADLTARDGRLLPVLLRFLSTAILLRVNELLRRAARQPTASAAEADARPDPATGVFTDMARREQADLVHRTLAELAPGDREVVVLRLVEQRPAAEVGTLLGTTAGAVHVRLHRALGRLRAALPPDLCDELATECGGDADT